MDDDIDYDDRYGDLDSDAFDSVYEDIYDDLDFEYGNSIPGSYTIKELWEDCLVPTVSDGFSASSHLLICSMLLRFVASLGFLPSYSFHLTSGLAGLYCLHHFFGTELTYVVILAVFGYTIVALVHYILGKYRGIICAVSCCLFLIICELFLVEHTLWHRIRGSQMVLTMKLISLAFDMDQSSQVFPDIIQGFGYLFSVGTVIFGPWISFTSYTNMQQEKNGSLKWALKILQSLCISFGFLTLSTCWSAYLLHHNWRWVAAYKDALSFRSSHYFISYLSEATTIATGLSATTGTWSMPVADPRGIEIPRSLVEVVICWNIPMHYWLKTYVFKTAKPLGNFAAVLLTYAASSLLHGLNFQLAAVLLSLGFYTYIEYVLRKKLASIYHACILARKCKKDCTHKYKNFHPYVLITNVSFGLLAMFHLAYLGVMFDSSSSLQEEGYSMQHTLDKWSELDFASHWVALVTYLFYILI